jgi:hypothetical protein
MASTFRNILKSNIGTSGATAVLVTGATAKTTVIGLSLTNLTGGIVLASILITDPNGGGSAVSASAHYMKDVVIPPNQSLRVINGGEKLILGSSTSVFITSNVNSSLDLVMSFVEIT